MLVNSHLSAWLIYIVVFVGGKNSWVMNMEILKVFQFFFQGIFTDKNHEETLNLLGKIKQHFHEF